MSQLNFSCVNIPALFRIFNRVPNQFLGHSIRSPLIVCGSNGIHIKFCGPRCVPKPVALRLHHFSDFARWLVRFLFSTKNGLLFGLWECPHTTEGFVSYSRADQILIKSAQTIGFSRCSVGQPMGLDATSPRGCLSAQAGCASVCVGVCFICFHSRTGILRHCRQKQTLLLAGRKQRFKCRQFFLVSFEFDPSIVCYMPRVYPQIWWEEDSSSAIEDFLTADLRLRFFKAVDFFWSHPNGA